MNQTETESMGEKEILQHVSQKVDQMYIYLCGDDEGGVTGLVKRVERLEEKINEYDRLKWKVIGIGSAMLPVLLFLWDLFKKWIESKI